MRSRKTMLGLLAVTAIGAAAVSAGARAHGEYDWIRQGGYQSIRGGPCCGVDDCYKIKPGDISVQGGKYRVKSWGAEFPVEHTLPSEDRHFWMCVDEMDVRCFFAPGGDV